MKVWVVLACENDLVGVFTIKEKADAICNAFDDCWCNEEELDSFSIPEVDLGLSLFSVTFRGGVANIDTERMPFSSSGCFDANMCIYWDGCLAGVVHCCCWARDAIHAVTKVSKGLAIHIATGLAKTKYEVIDD